MSENSWVENWMLWILGEHYALHHLRSAQKGQYSFPHGCVFVNHLGLS